MSARRASRVPIDLTGLSARQQIFRIGEKAAKDGAVQSTAAKPDAAVEAWLNEPVALRPLALEWFTRMRECGGDVRDMIHDGCPVACIADAPFGYVNAFKNHVSVGFFNGAALADPEHLLEGSGKHMRHVKLHPDERVNEPALRALIGAAYRDLKRRLAAEGNS